MCTGETICGSHLVIANHRRSYANGEEIYNLDHYLETLYTKPRALEDAKPFKRAQLPAVFQKYLEKLKEHHQQPEREFVRTLMLHRETDWEALAGALEEGCRQGIYQTDGIKQFLEKMTGKHLVTAPLPPVRHSHLADFKVERPRLSKFDLLLGQSGGGGGWFIEHG